MTEQIIQILERKTTSDVWKVRTVIQLWPADVEERQRLYRFTTEEPEP